MARAKKKKSAAKKKSKAPARGRVAAKPKKGKSAKKGAKKAGKSSVEGRWREYWQCRTKLEEAVEAVRDAEAQLAEARTVERERRELFNTTKETLKDLLEVEPASASGGDRGSALLDFPGVEPRGDDSAVPSRQ